MLADDTLITLDQAAGLIPGADADTLKRVDYEDSPTPDASEIESLLAELRGQQIVYFVGFMQYVKIGFTANLSARMRALNNMPAPLAIFHFEPGTLRDEKAYHKRFASLRICNEWFEHRSELATFIAEKRHSVVLFT